MSFTQAGSPQVDLVFNDEGKKIFGELTKRLIGKQIAIFVGGQLLTAPTVQAVIPAITTEDQRLAANSVAWSTGRLVQIIASAALRKTAARATTDVACHVR